MPTNGQYVVGELVTSADANNVFSRGNQNAIINGDFFINQRGFSTLSGAQFAFGFDRWRLSSTGGATWTPQAFTLGNAITGYEPTTFSRVVTSGQSGATVYSLILQYIEDVRTFAGQTTTLSFWAKANSGTPKIAVEISQNFGTGGSPSAQVDTYAGQITLSTTWTRHTLQIAVPSITGKTLGTTANTHFLGLNLFVSAGSNFNARTGSLGIQSNTFDIWGVQWETGQVATPFQIPDRADELARAQRFYWRHNGTMGQFPGFMFGAATGSTSPAGRRMVCPNPVTMRAAPTLNYGGAFQYGGGNGVYYAVTALGFNSSSTMFTSTDINSATALTAQLFVHGILNGTAATDFFDASAEL